MCWGGGEGGCVGGGGVLTVFNDLTCQQKAKQFTTLLYIALQMKLKLKVNFYSRKL